MNLREMRAYNRKGKGYLWHWAGRLLRKHERTLKVFGRRRMQDVQDNEGKKERNNNSVPSSRLMRLCLPVFRSSSSRCNMNVVCWPLIIEQ